MKTIMITGASSGLGRAIAEQALARGHRVVGTFRNEAQREAFEGSVPGRSLGVMLDVTHTGAIAQIVQSLESTVGALDVIVNNAGYGLQGVVEELDLDALRQQLEVNVIGQVAVIQAVLPGMRSRRAGHIVNIASMGSIVTFPGLGAYHASKFALLGLNDALAQEVAGFGIHVTAILPGVFRSDWQGRSQKHSERSVADYDSLLAVKADIPWGDPAALGRAVLDAIEMDTPPAHLLVGPVALVNVRDRLAEWSSEIDRWQALSEAGGQG